MQLPTARVRWAPGERACRRTQPHRSLPQVNAKQAGARYIAMWQNRAMRIVFKLKNMGLTWCEICTIELCR